MGQLHRLRQQHLTRTNGQELDPRETVSGFSSVLSSACPCCGGVLTKLGEDVTLRKGKVAARRAPSIRYDKRADNYFASIKLALARIWMRQIGTLPVRTALR